MRELKYKLKYQDKDDMWVSKIAYITSDSKLQKHSVIRFEGDLYIITATPSINSLIAVLLQISDVKEIV